VTGAGRVLAVDLGATSVRVAAVDLDADDPAVEVVHRWPHGPVAHGDGSLRWDWEGIVAEVERGLDAGTATGPVASIGVDGWGVDYGLLDGRGELVAPPWSYRDRRTEGWMATADRIGPERLYEITGVQQMAVNSIFQLATHERAELDRAERLLLLPDLLVHHLTGHAGAERSNASTTGLLDARTGTWSDELVGDISVRRSLFPEPANAGTLAGTWREVPVHLVGSHDTASAFLGMPGGAASGTVFVSAGTWVIAGVERPEVDTSPESRAANFSNEAGALGGFRFLRNVIGFWLLERCRRAWGDPPLEALLAEAAVVGRPVPSFDVEDERFLAPPEMEAEIRDAAGIDDDAPRGVIVASVLGSIADGVSRIVADLETVTGEAPQRLAVVGGGARAGMFHELLARQTGLPVVAGSPEATALGNAVVQGIALGRFDGLPAARSWLEPTGSRM
jgi:rhamnulokinase